MAAKVYRSECCNETVKTGGLPDFVGSKEVCTIYFICLKCNKPCNVVKTRVFEININDDIEIRLTEDGRKFYKEYVSKYRHKPLKKSGGGWVRVAFWEFINIFGSRMFMGAEDVVVSGTIRIIKKEK
ncbi:MAG: hypothetical protein HYT12_01100 [Candidatus Liptonbacteria bacterium]|nr:hypothetical protein [Candidatus Liptonbacteria bacterium]